MGAGPEPKAGVPMDARIDERAILRWAAGAPVRLPRFDRVNDDRILYLLGIDEEYLADLVSQHRLAHRLLARYVRERPGWCSPTFLHRVGVLAAEAERRSLRQLEAARELTRE